MGLSDTFLQVDGPLVHFTLHEIQHLLLNEFSLKPVQCVMDYYVAYCLGYAFRWILSLAQCGVLDYLAFAKNSRSTS
jgi:hypothetical protein